MSTLLVGAGQMAVDYARVLNGLDEKVDVVGRSYAVIESFTAATSLAAQSGGVEAYLAKSRTPERAIVAVGVPSLADVTLALLEAGVQEVLVEKPAGLTLSSVQAVRDRARAAKARVFVGYNRRFYASTAAAREQIARDGGLRAVEFEFTEWIGRVAASAASDAVKERWIIANSSHVIDLAFHLAGAPTDWSSRRAGGLDWHSSGSRFVGSGTTIDDVLFSYVAVWGAPGRWGVTLRTPRRRLRLQPLERLFVSDDGVQETEVALPSSDDTDFKPGLYRQVQAFLAGDSRYLCSIEEHAAMMPVYNEIAGYPDE